MKIFKNRTVIAGLCLVAAALIAFAVLPRFYADRKATATVYRAANAIPKGTLIEATHLSAVETGAFNLPAGLITDPNEIICDASGSFFGLSGNAVSCVFLYSPSDFSSALSLTKLWGIRFSQ